MNLTHAVDRPGPALNVDSKSSGKGIGFQTNEDSDIVEICVRHLGIDPKANRGFLERLYNRRQDVFGNKHWRKKLGDQKVNQMLSYWSQNFSRIVQA
jgi:hypothetical protein